jgi:hypothetical protein
VKIKEYGRAVKLIAQKAGRTDKLMGSLTK